MKINPCYRAILNVKAVSANLANTEFQGTVECLEIKENGKSKRLWLKRTGQKMRRLNKADALQDAIELAMEIKFQNFGVDTEIIGGGAI